MVAEVETWTWAGLDEVPTLVVPLEPTIRPVPVNVTPEPETAPTLPEAVATEKFPPPNPPPPPPNPPPLPPPPPNPPPPPPLPPNPLPPEPVAGDGHGEPEPVIATERAATGPPADPLVGGVPVTATQLPTVRSCAVAETVCEKVVDDVHCTEVVLAPANWLSTVIDDPDTAVTDPDATGRALGIVVDVAEEAEVDDPDALEHAAASRPRAPTSTT